MIPYHGEGGRVADELSLQKKYIRHKRERAKELRLRIDC
jgi:hypothetical protein